LIELVIAIVILGIVSVLTCGIVVMNAQTFRTVTDNTVSRWDLRETLNKLKYDLREINPMNVLVKGKLSGDALAFKTVDGHVLQFRVINNNLVRKYDTGGWEVLIENLKADPFVYLDRKLNTTNKKSELQYIDIHLKIQKNNKDVDLHEIVYVHN